MNDKELLKLLGINDTTITFGLDEEKKKEEQINFYKKEYENFKEKKRYIDMFKDTYVYGKIKDTLIRDGFIYRCPFCLDVSGQYAKYPKNHKH